MNLLQAAPSKIEKNSAWKTGFSSQKCAYPTLPQTPAGYEKGNVRPCNLHKMNNMRIIPRYLSVNRTTSFLPFFLAKKWAFLPENRPFLA
jgi:hypothetical protein